MKRFVYVILAVLAITAVAVYAQQPKTTAPAPHDHHAMAAGEHHCNMMSSGKEMSDKTTAMDTKLQSLVTTMNSATGSDKVDAMSAVINELVAQRAQMHNGMMSMHGAMSGCCMKDGGVHTASKGMEGCPMHKGTR